MKKAINAALYWVLTTLLVTITFFFGLAFITFGAYEAHKKLSASNWLSVEATIVSNSIYETHTRNGTLWCPDWSYSYEVIGIRYQSNKMEPTITTSRHCFTDKAEAEENINNLPVGSKVIAHYNPNNTSQSAIIVTKVGVFEFLLIFSGFILFLGGISICSEAIKHKKNSIKANTEKSVQQQHYPS